MGISEIRKLRGAMSSAALISIETIFYLFEGAEAIALAAKGKSPERLGFRSGDQCFALKLRAYQTETLRPSM